MTATIDTSCPQCRAALTVLGSGPPWCPECEWGLDRYGDDRQPELGWRWVDRLSYRLAYRLTQGQHAELSRNPGRPLPRAGRTRALLIAIAVLMLAATIALFALGVYLIVAYFFGPLTIVGALLVLVAIALRPRLGRLERDADHLDEATAPELFHLIRQVAGAIGARAPDIVGVNDEFNAASGAIGVRRRRVLYLGLPLWGALTPQQRVALLGHELGHFVNGDVRRGMLTQVPLTTTAEVARMLRPGRDITRSRRGLIMLISSALATVVLGVMRNVVLGTHIALQWLALRDSQHAEYLADDLAAGAGGSRAAAELFDVLGSADVATMLIARDARAGLGPDAWRTTVTETLEASAPRRPVQRQRWIRDEVSMFASHPPTGLRARLVEARPARPAEVVLTEAVDARIDEELSRRYATVRRSLAAG